MGNTDEQAIRRVLDGDRDACGILMGRHFNTVYRIAFRITENQYDAEEAIRATFVRAT